MKVHVIGSGYVGLVTGACFASVGNQVTLVDIDEAKIKRLQQGESPIFEPGLEEMLTANIAAGRLTFSTDTTATVGGADIVFLAVGTPSAEDGSVDLSALWAAARDVARGIEEHAVVVTKSTVPVGTARKLKAWMQDHTTVAFDIASNPEFLKEGAAVSDFLNPDRVVVGTDSDRALEALRRLYSPFMHREDRLIAMDPTSAELTKYACNAMLATRISLMNELTGLCESVGADIRKIQHGVGTDKRIGRDFLYASLGYGGSCFPKDVRALMSMGGEHGRPMQLVQATYDVNQEQQRRFFQRIADAFEGDLVGVKVMVWGLAFKARTDDIRESAAMTIVELLLDAGATVTVHDPKALDNARSVLGERVTYAADPYLDATGADALVIATEWKEYRVLQLDHLSSCMHGRRIFDGRNLYDASLFSGSEFTYHSIGRPSVHPE